MADAKAVFKKVFPFISTAASLGGPLAVMGANALGSALGVKVEPTNEGVTDALTKASANAEQLLVAQKAEQDFKLQCQSLGFQHAEEMEKIAAADRADARNMEIKTGDTWTPRILAGIVVVGWLLVQWFLLEHVVPSEMREIIMRSLGTLDMALGLVLGFYFGSSAGSEAKTSIIANGQSKDK